jgi:response regulator RpfG family c-di-GMP phosphodiesterase
MAEMSAQILEESKPKVLVVDDSPEILKIISRILSREFEVITGEDVPAGEAALREHPDIRVIVCDHHMPGEDGLSFLTRLQDQFPKLQRILLTGYSEAELMLRGINEARLFRYLEKPIDRRQLAEAVQFAALEYDILCTMDFVATERERLEQELKSWPKKCKRFSQALTRILRSSGQFLTSFLVLQVTGLAIVVAMALVALVIVYVVKSVMGINLLEHMHVEDVIRRIFPAR